MAALLTARRQHLAASHRFHAGAEAVRLVATPDLGLKRTLGQRMLLWSRARRTLESASLCDPQRRVKQPAGKYPEGKNRIHPTETRGTRARDRARCVGRLHDDPIAPAPLFVASPKSSRTSRTRIFICD